MASRNLKIKVLFEVNRWRLVSVSFGKSKDTLIQLHHQCLLKPKNLEQVWKRDYYFGHRKVGFSTDLRGDSKTTIQSDAWFITQKFNHKNKSTRCLACSGAAPKGMSALIKFMKPEG